MGAGGAGDLSKVFDDGRGLTRDEKRAKEVERDTDDEEEEEEDKDEEKVETGKSTSRDALSSTASACI